MQQTPAEFHPDLARFARFAPRHLPLGPRLLRVLRFALKAQRTPSSTKTVRIEDRRVPGLRGAPPVLVRVYRPVVTTDVAPGAYLWIHGGGLVLGSPGIDDATCIKLVDTLGIVVASVDYRLAIDDPHPAALDDCEAALRWLIDDSADKTRIAIGGESAGGGLAAALAQRATDLGLPVALQVLVYPMLDDRTTLRTDVDPRSLRMWSARNNIYGWSAYLGDARGTANVSADAAPARRERLEGLPPAWIGVGTADLFHDEDVEYARRLTAAGVPCTLRVVDGAFHGFWKVALAKPVAREFDEAHTSALREALCRPR